MKLRRISKSVVTMLCIINAPLVFAALQEVPLELTAGQQQALAHEVALHILKRGVEVHAAGDAQKAKKKSSTRSGGYQAVSSSDQKLTLSELLRNKKVAQSTEDSKALITSIKTALNNMSITFIPEKGSKKGQRKSNARTRKMTFIELYQAGQFRSQPLEALEQGLKQAAETAVQDALVQASEGASLKQVGVALEESMQEQIITVASLALAAALTGVGIPVTPMLLTPLVKMTVEGVYKAGSLVIDTIEHSTCCIKHQKDEKARFELKEGYSAPSGNYQTF